jgi:hypothetical protein
MSSPFIFIATNRLKAGQLDRERERVPGLVEFIEANEPRLIARRPAARSSTRRRRGGCMSAREGFSNEEARRIGEQIGIDWDSSPFDVDQFRRGMDVELEHGLHDLLTNVTDDDPVTTGKIARAHLNEFPDYYTRLEQMEEQAKREGSGGQAPR